jgi:hypothetical protein
MLLSLTVLKEIDSKLGKVLFAIVMIIFGPLGGLFFPKAPPYRINPHQHNYDEKDAPSYKKYTYGYRDVTNRRK